MTNSYKVAETMGGYAVFSHAINSDLQFFAEISRGLPVGALEQLVDHHLLSRAEAAHLIITPRTLARRKKKQRLSLQESDRLARVARIITYAREVLGDQEKAYAWLRRPNRALENRLPLDLLETEIGARVVETILGRMEQGVYS